MQDPDIKGKKKQRIKKTWPMQHLRIN